jgi:Membrane-fusion protein
MTTAQFFRTRRLAAVLFLACPGACLIGPAHAAPSDPLGCLITPNHTAEIGSPVIGVLESVRVERGDFVKKGQVLARLNSGVERAAAGAAAARARLEAEVDLARANVDLAERKHKRTQDLERQNFLSAQAMEQVEIETVLAKLKLAQTSQELRVAERESDLAGAQLGQRSLRSPFTGFVMERYMSPGERVENKPVLKLAAIDPLWVELIMPVADYGKIRLGERADVSPETIDTAARSARVIQIDRFIDPASNSFRVRLSLPNPKGNLPPGLRCKIHWADVAAAPPPPARSKR